MKLLYGTTNPAKLHSMKKALRPLGIELMGLSDLDKPLPEVAEDGIEPIENARQKSEAYYKTFQMPVFSCDSGLYFTEAPHVEQPGAFVRRYTGVHMTEDEALIRHFSQVAKANGGAIKAQYINAISLVINQDTIFDFQGPSISSKPFLLMSEPHEKRVQGFPLDALSVHIDSGQYYYDLLDQDEDQRGWEQGMREFFKMHLPKLLVD